VATAFATTFLIQDSILLGLGHAPWVPVINVVFGFGKIVLLIVIAKTIDANGWESLIWSWWASIMLGAVVEAVLIDRLAQRHQAGGPHTDYQLPKFVDVGRFALVHHLSTMLLNLPPLIFPVLVLQMLGDVAAAHFYTTWMIASLLMLVAQNIANVMVTQAARANADVSALARQGMWYAAALVLPGVVVLIVAGRFVLRIFGSDYEQGYALLIVLALATLIQPINTFAMGILRVRLQLRPVLIQGSIAGAVTLGCAWPMGAALGLPGFGLAYLLGLCAALVVGLPQIRHLLVTSPGAR